MVTYNTSVTYNQPKMNLGQGILLGAFGALTGNQGCYGMGGYGMGGYGMGYGTGYGMGYGASIYSSYGICGTQYGCCPTMGYDNSFRYAAINGGMAALNVVSQYVQQAIYTHKANKAAQKQADAANSTKIENLKNEIKELQKKIDKPDDYIDNSELKQADKTIAEKNLAKNNASNQYDKLYNRQNELNNKKINNTITSDETAELAKLNNDVNTEGSVAWAKKQLDDADKAVKEANEAKQNAIEAYEKAKFELIKTTDKEIDRKNDELKKLQSKPNAEIENKMKNNNLMITFIDALNNYTTAKSTNLNNPNSKTELDTAYKAIKDNNNIDNKFKALATKKYEEATGEQ